MPEEQQGFVCVCVCACVCVWQWRGGVYPSPPLPTYIDVQIFRSQPISRSITSMSTSLIRMAAIWVGRVRYANRWGTGHRHTPHQLLWVCWQNCA